MLNKSQLLTVSVSKARSFAILFVQHLRVHWITYLAIWAFAIVVKDNYLFGFNQSPSLPQSVFLIHKNEPVKKGDYVSFHVPPKASSKFKHPNAILTKIMVGTEGDRISVKDRIVEVNGVPVGFAKEKSLKGENLDPIEERVVTSGHYYLMGLHKDSLDSRYTLIGLVPQSSVIGRAYPIF